MVCVGVPAGAMLARASVFLIVVVVTSTLLVDRRAPTAACFVGPRARRLPAGGFNPRFGIDSDGSRYVRRSGHSWQFRKRCFDPLGFDSRSHRRRRDAERRHVLEVVVGIQQG